jgi:MFS transporter, NNP family, nitrate/nitrite transporter
MKPTITRWDPEDREFWAREGRAIARRNLAFSIFAEHLGFAVWVLWSVIAVKLPDAGFRFSTGELFWLVSVPGLVGATLRFPYTFAPARFGGRTWTTISALLLLVPVTALAVMVSDPGTPYWAFLLAAATAGLGGGNFAASMANISHFFPDSEKGFALALNAAGGNIAVAVAQKVVPLIILVGGSLQLANAGLIWVPFILVAAFCAWRYMDNLGTAESSWREQAVIVRRRHTWLLTLLYVGTFGSFIGYSAALPLLIKTQFAGIDPLAYAFLGPLIGSLARPVGGHLSDRIGGARVTLGSVVGMAAVVPALIATLHHGDAFGPFLACFFVLFALAGVANGAVFRIVPIVFRDHALREAQGGTAPRTAALARARREAAACLGFCSAVGAYGAFLIPQAFRWSLAATGGLDAALYGFLAFYAACVGLTWWCYARPRFATGLRHPEPEFARA